MQILHVIRYGDRSRIIGTHLRHSLVSDSVSRDAGDIYVIEEAQVYNIICMHLRCMRMYVCRS